MRLGDLDLHLVSDGELRLDGGAMFGVVPRPLWERSKPADESNRIRMGTNCLLVRRGDELLLIDAGLGDKLDEKTMRLSAIDPNRRRLPDAIRDAGFEPGDVGHVLLSHLHFDHCGWSTVKGPAGLAPTFPRARYWLQRDEVSAARSPDPRSRPSYDPRNFEPLFEAGVVELFDEAAEPLPGVRAVRVPGHTAGMCIVLLDGGDPGERGVFWADLVPTSAHTRTAWVMSYDLFPLQTMANKERWLPRAASEGWLCVFEHDPDVPLGRLIEERPGRYRTLAVDPGHGRYLSAG